MKRIDALKLHSRSMWIVIKKLQFAKIPFYLRGILRTIFCKRH